MAGNSFGKVFTLTTFGESHGEAIGGVIDGCPAGLTLDFDAIKSDMARRRPGQSALSTPRSEQDEVHWLSGIFEGVTTGTPIGFIIYNGDKRSSDYDALKQTYRPSHADFTYASKYGVRDHRGGGRSSARETAVRVAAGAVAKQLLGRLDIRIQAYVSAVADVTLEADPESLELMPSENEVRCPDERVASQMVERIATAREEGDSLGGIITTVVRKVPAGWGEPVFDKLHADLGKAMLSINAVKGFEIGTGFAAARMRGSDHNDQFSAGDSKRLTVTNHAGGVLGGISNGMAIWFRTAFKPVASIAKEQQGLVKGGATQALQVKGRHDPCVVPRAVPIVEAMTALVLADHYLRNTASRL